MCREFYLNQQKSFLCVCVDVWKRRLHLRKRMHQLTMGCQGRKSSISRERVRVRSRESERRGQKVLESILKNTEISGSKFLSASCIPVRALISQIEHNSTCSQNSKINSSLLSALRKWKLPLDMSRPSLGASVVSYFLFEVNNHIQLSILR